MGNFALIIAFTFLRPKLIIGPISSPEVFPSSPDPLLTVPIEYGVFLSFMILLKRWLKWHFSMSAAEPYHHPACHPPLPPGSWPMLLVAYFHYIFGSAVSLLWHLVPSCQTLCTGWCSMPALVILSFNGSLRFMLVFLLALFCGGSSSGYHTQHPLYMMLVGGS